MNAIRLDSICDGIQDSHGIKEVTVAIEEGTSIYLQGDIGNGSRLLSIMGLAAKPDSGKVYALDEDTSSMNEKQRAALRNQCFGFIGAAYPLIESWSVEKNVGLPLMYCRKDVNSIDRKSKAKAILDEMKLSSRAREIVSALSREERIMVQIARARAGGGSILLADNPTEGLTREASERIVGLMLDMNNQGVTIVATGKDEAIAERFSQRLMLEDGRLKEEYWGPPKEATEGF